MEKRVAFYVRVSTKDKQDYQYQIDTLEDYSKLKISSGLVDVFEEKVSGYKHGDERPKLKQLLEIIEEDNSKYDCLYVTEISRIGRRATHVREVLEVLERNKVNLKIKSLGIELLDVDKRPNAHGRLVLSIFIEMADIEALVFKQRSRDGIKAGIKAGHAGGGAFLPYGFKKDGKKLVVNEIEASVVRDIFNYYLQGLGVKKIANILNARNVKTRTNISFENKSINSKTGKLGKDVQWVDKTVDDILLNPIYTGKRRYWGGKESKRNNSMPELIDLVGETILNPISIYDDCLEIRKTKTHKNYLTKYTYLLKDKIVCSKCGRNYFARFKPNDGEDKVYICSSRLIKGGNCGSLGLNISLIESSIFNEIISSDSMLKHINENDEIKKKLFVDSENLKLEIKHTEDTIISLENDLSSIISLQIDAKKKNNHSLVQRYQTKLEEKIKQLELLQASLPKYKRKLALTENAIKRNSSIKTTIKDLIQNNHDRTKLRSIFLNIIDKVYVKTLGKDLAFVDVHIALDGVVIPVTLKLFLDTKSIKKASKVYRYIPFLDIGSNLIYNNNILELDESILRERFETIKENLGLLDYIDYQIIPEKNILNVLDDRFLIN